MLLPRLHSVTDVQAAGSSLLARLANLLVADALGRAGLGDLGASTVLPLATGMALTLTLLALRPLRPSGARCGERVLCARRLRRCECAYCQRRAVTLAVVLPLLCARGSLLVRDAVRAGAFAHLQFAQKQPAVLPT